MEGIAERAMFRLESLILLKLSGMLTSPRHPELRGQLHHTKLELRRISESTTDPPKQTQPCPRLYPQAGMAS